MIVASAALRTEATGVVSIQPMLDRITAPNGVVFYRSSLLAAARIPHAFSTRIGGDSPAPFDSLNLGNPNGCDVQDSYERIWNNYRLLETAAGCPGRDLCHVHQVHADNVVWASTNAPFDNSIKADAIATDDPGKVVSVRVADCVPILLATEDGKMVAAIHAGWRGVIANILAAAIAVLREKSADTPLLLAIGPSIGLDSFEVGGEVLDEFQKAFGSKAPLRRRTDGKGHVDLKKCLELQAASCGIAPERVDVSTSCTFLESDEFFSHRRENGVTGRMAAIIAPSQR